MEKETKYSLGKEGLDAFRMERIGILPEESLRAQIVSYLDEYRLQVAEHSYRLALSGNKICDPFTGEFMTDVTRRSIDRNRFERKPFYREQAELRGLSSGEKQIENIKDTGTFFWFSPQGPKEEGYGDYGFAFVGQVNKARNEIRMTGFRVEHPTIEQFNQAFRELTGFPSQRTNAVEFLESPVVAVKEIPKTKVEEVLEKVFGYFNNEKTQKINREIVDKTMPFINEFIATSRFSSKDEKIRDFQIIENLVLEQKRKHRLGHETREDLGSKKLKDLAVVYSFRPEAVAGSCGMTSEVKSNSPFGLDSNIFKKRIIGEEDEDYDFNRIGDCIGKSCGRKNINIGPCGLCRSCDQEIKSRRNVLAA